MQRSLLARTAVLTGLLVGCGSKTEPARPADKAAAPDASSAATEKATAPAAPPEFRGTVRGIVRLAAGSALPLATPPERTEIVAAKGCPPITEADLRLVSESGDTRGLSPLHVAVTGMSAAPPREPITHELSIRDCRLEPGMVAAMTGDKLRVVNRSSVTFLPLLPRETFMQALLPGVAREVPIEGIGPVSIKCGLGSFCGEATLLSTAHSLYAVTDSEGRFTIDRVPLEQEVTLHAWHPLFKPTSATFKLTQGEPSKELELLIEPLTPVAADAGAPTPPPTPPATRANKSPKRP